jgi:hypothetical protein
MEKPYLAIDPQAGQSTHRLVNHAACRAERGTVTSKPRNVPEKKHLLENLVNLVQNMVAFDS